MNAIWRIPAQSGLIFALLFPNRSIPLFWNLATDSAWHSMNSFHLLLLA
jgi:thiosulfate reductase cytochrome b subunit